MASTSNTPESFTLATLSPSTAYHLKEVWEESIDVRSLISTNDPSSQPTDHVCPESNEWAVSIANQA
jgi:hypothetical protein